MKLKSILSILFVCFALIQTKANTYTNDANNTLYVDAASVTPGGQVTLTIKMKNSVVISGFQFEMYLPDGVTADYTTDSWGDIAITSSMSSVRANAANFTYSASFPETNKYTHVTVLCYATNKSIAAGDGEVATIKLNVDKSVGGADYNILLKNVVISNTSDTYETTTDISSKLTVKTTTSLKGDVNEDGKVDIQDVNTLIDILLKKS